MPNALQRNNRELSEVERRRVIKRIRIAFDAAKTISLEPQNLAPLVLMLVQIMGLMRVNTPVTVGGLIAVVADLFFQARRWIPPERRRDIFGQGDNEWVKDAIKICIRLDWCGPKEGFPPDQLFLTHKGVAQLAIPLSGRGGDLEQIPIKHRTPAGMPPCPKGFSESCHRELYEQTERFWNTRFASTDLRQWTDRQRSKWCSAMSQKPPGYLLSNGKVKKGRQYIRSASEKIPKDFR